jgi:NAD(P)-dependent dehydrogenase (short-subunit alcohol dehydrogenase family)
VASKHGVAALTTSAALEYAKSGIRINTVCRGFIRTAMVERVIDGDSINPKAYPGYGGLLHRRGGLPSYG